MDLYAEKKSYLSVFQMTIMTTITVASLRGLPAMAIEGKASIIMYLVPAILFLVPTALVGAELASTYQGGIYVWVKEAFGNKVGVSGDLVAMDSKCRVVSDSIGIRSSSFGICHWAAGSL